MWAGIANTGISALVGFKNTFSPVSLPQTFLSLRFHLELVILQNNMEKNGSSWDVVSSENQAATRCGFDTQREGGFCGVLVLLWTVCQSMTTSFRAGERREVLKR